MRWNAVWAGWLLATGVAAMFYAFGLAVGLSGFNFNDAAAITQGISRGTVVWMLLTWGASLWLGGMFASWFDGRNDTEMGVIRGLAVWGLSMTATSVLIATGMMHLNFGTLPSTDSAPSLDAATLAQYTSKAMWTAFGCALLSLVASAFGGWLGAQHVHRVYHLRSYTPHRR
ncbi:MAG TPA: hypothetical protein VN693_07070 [Rhodanobacteraceae bacterium]|nr:hypothetical protein [Rhodanobacteraceae bacterium]